MAGKKNIVPGSAYAYRPGSTPLHKLNAGIKLLGLLAISIVSFVFGPWICAPLSVLLVAGAASAGMTPPALLRGSKPLLFMLCFVVVFRAINGSFFNGVFFAWSALVSFCAGALLFSVTTMTEIKNALSRLSPRLALALSLMLGFIPRFFEVWEDRRTAYRARNGKAGPASLAYLVPASVEKMIEKAAATAAALESRSGV
jgi:biotin transport system permease protein